jgi:hypothetical protein
MDPEVARRLAELITRLLRMTQTDTHSSNNLSEWLDFVSSLVSSLAWPIAACAIAFLFRTEIRRLIGNIRRLRTPVGDVDFEERVEEATERAEDLELPVTEPTSATQTSASPREAILTAWIEIETALRIVATRLNLPGDPFNSTRVLTQLRRRELANEEVLGLIRELRALRNRAAHESDFSISEDAVGNYQLVTRRVVGYILGLGMSPPQDPVVPEPSP